MARVLRQDAGVQLRQMRRDANGDLLFEATVARVGVLEYLQPDGSVRRELVTPENLFAPASMATLPGRPVTDTHPSVMFAAAEVPPRAAGVTGQVRRDGRYLIAAGRISDPGLAQKVESERQRETSPGYFCDLDETPGVWVHPEYAPQGERYDAIQGPREYDHLAVVPVGRCAGTCGGETCVCAIRTDDAGRAGREDSMAAKNQKRRAVRRDESALKELILKAYPDDAAAALEAYDKVMAEMGAMAPEEPAPAVDADDDDEQLPPAGGGYPERQDAVDVKRLLAENEALKAQLANREKEHRDAAQRIREDIEWSRSVRDYARQAIPGYSDRGKDDVAVQRDVLKHFHRNDAAGVERFDAMDADALKTRVDTVMSLFPGTNLGELARIDTKPKNDLAEKREKFYARQASFANGKAAR